MKRLLLIVLACMALQAQAQMPSRYKWLGNNEIAFTQDGSYNDAFSITVKGRKWTRKDGVKAPEKYSDFPLNPSGAVNLTYSPDSTKLAFTRDNDLWVADIATGAETRLTFDGTETVMNGYASWVYYEEIFGRPSRYRAFWWAPDSRTIAFYRFDDTEVPMFPIYSPFGQDGTLRRTHYPKAGEKNPEVRIGFVSAAGSPITWADFNPVEDQYFGTPFWSSDSRTFYVSREPRIQNTLDLYAVDPVDGSKKAIYHEKVDTWLDWIDGMLFTDKGLYMARNFEIEITADQGLSMMVLHGFHAYDEVHAYAQKLYLDEHMARRLEGIRTLLISEDNLKLLGTDFSFDDYKAFYDEHFAPLDIPEDLQIDEPENLEIIDPDAPQPEPEPEPDAPPVEDDDDDFPFGF